MGALELEAMLESGGPGARWTTAALPPHAADALGSEASIPVSGTVNEAPFHGTVRRMRGGLNLLVPAAALRAANARAGDIVRLSLRPSEAPAVPATPEDLLAALAAEPAAHAAFQRLPPSHRREYVAHIGEAKRPETRSRRIAETVRRLSQGSPAPKE
jgi:hypothetical protein